LLAAALHRDDLGEKWRMAKNDRKEWFGLKAVASDEWLEVMIKGSD
jgi:hypothetical protein